MHNRIGFSMILTLCAALCTAGCQQHSEAQPALTADYLAGSVWGPEEGPETFGQHLEFKKDGSYLDRWVGPGGCFYTGTFTVTGGAAVLTNTGRQECSDKKAYVNRCVLQQAPESPSYSVKLVCGKNNVYYRHNNPVREGSAVNIRGVSSVATGLKNAESTTDLMFRESPVTNARAFTATMYCEGPERTVKSLPKGSGFTVLARTRDKARVSAWQNYWYYIHVGGGECFNPERNRGWVYGEFIRFTGK